MRRSILLKVAVHCPHFDRTVTATRNEVIDRLVACSDAHLCRDPAPPADAHEHQRPYPRGCPVFPTLAK